jgi:hypothetical protein
LRRNADPDFGFASLLRFVRVAEMKLKSRREAKGLLLDISYLKTKFTRENSFREDLSLQKEYLLILIGGLSRQYASLSLPLLFLPSSKH